MTIKRVKIINKKEFTKVALYENVEAFVVYVALLIFTMTIYLARKALIALLVIEKMAIPAEYLNYANVFSKKSAVELFERSAINQHTIDLEPDKQSPYGPIYSLGLMKLKTLKTYIETNLANGFIRLLKSPAKTSILFVERFDGSFRLCVYYRDLNNLTIKNRYPLLLIGELLNQLGQAKKFTQLDLTSV